LRSGPDARHPCQDRTLSSGRVSDRRRRGASKGLGDETC
jgi:hypothetical protein